MSTATSYSKWRELRGSHKSISRGAVVAEPFGPAQTIQVAVRLRRKSEFAGKPEPGRRMSREEHERHHGGIPEDFEKVKAFATHFGLSVYQELREQRLVVLEGTTADFEKAFQVKLHLHRFPNGSSYRGRTGMIQVPDEIADVVVGVFGLDNRRVAWPAVRFLPATAASGKSGSQTPGPVTAFYPNELAQLYNFPTGLDGSGQKIGIVELGGGYSAQELQSYYRSAGVKNFPKVSVRPVVGGATNQPAPEDPEQPDVEVLLDMEVAGTVAPGAELLMYFVKNGSEKQVLLGISAAVHDSQEDISVLSLSFGGPEYDPVTMGTGVGADAVGQYQENINDLFQTAGHLGITVCVATGDQGSACEPLGDPNRPWDGKAHAGFPASSPFALACGGTHIVTPTAGKPTEEVWHPAANTGTGGGVSRYFKRPDYQQQVVTQDPVNPAAGPGRGIPDVSADAAQESGYRVLCDGTWYPDSAKHTPPVGGTSASTPLWAALIALFNQSLNTRLGFINPLLYKIGSPSSAFFDVTGGDNGDYKSGIGWDPCTGLGSPNGNHLLQALKPLLAS